MALKIVFLVFLGWVAYLLLFDTGPAQKGFEICALRARSNFTRLESEGRERHISADRLCELRQEQLIYDQGCIEQVKKNHLTGSVLFWVSRSRPKINSVIREHNRYCAGHELPVYDIELSS